MVCGGVGSCPVCAPKIQERRRLEIAHAMDWAYKTMDKKCVMVTITFPHKAWDRIEKLLDQHAEALKYLRGGKAWSKYMKKVGFEGLIRALELTYGQNGWHPHTHEIWIVDRDTDADELREKVLNRWKAACIKAGLLDENDERQVKGFEKHSVDVHDNARIGDYLAKLTEAGQLPEEEKGHWGADREVGKASTKKGLSKGIHPFRLLDRYDAGDKQAGELYAEYMEVMKKKRKRQLYWSPGLKAKVDLQEFTDRELAEKKESPADLFGLLGADDWFYIRYKEAKGEILAIAINEGWEGIQAWLKKAGKEVRAAIAAKRKIVYDSS